jgi:hypothetical protein
MARSAVLVLTDERLHRRVAGAARRAVHQRFCDVKIVPIYEAYYREVLQSDPVTRDIPATPARPNSRPIDRAG